MSGKHKIIIISLFFEKSDFLECTMEICITFGLGCNGDVSFKTRRDCDALFRFQIGQENQKVEDRFKRF